MIKYLVITSGIIGAALLYLLSSASANTDLFSHNYYILLVMTERWHWAWPAWSLRKYGSCATNSSNRCTEPNLRSGWSLSFR